MQHLIAPLSPFYVLLVLGLIAFPFLANDFWTVEIGARALILGLIALSLMFLGGYGGMVSLAQMTIAGCAGYMIAIFGSDSANLGLGWPLWEVVPLAVVIATGFAVMVAVLSVRTHGIYTIMITLAIGVAFFYFTQQNYAIFNGFTGFAGLKPPVLFGVDWRAAKPFYYLSLVVAALAYFGVSYISRSTFGLALQAARDNARRMEALGFNVKLHQIAAYGLAGVIAALGGIELAWLNGRVSPGMLDVEMLLNILMIAVIGGMRRPMGPFIGALIFILLQNFAIDIFDPERFRTMVGTVFLVIVLFSPDGILGQWDRLKSYLSIASIRAGTGDKERGL